MASQNSLQAFSHMCRTLMVSNRCQQKFISFSNLRKAITSQSHSQRRCFATSQSARQHNTYPTSSSATDASPTISSTKALLDKLLEDTGSKQPKTYERNRQVVRPGRSLKLDSLNSLDRSHNDLQYDKFSSISNSLAPIPQRKAPELGPNVGRSVLVQKGDVTMALNRLRRVLQTNNVRNDSITQKFHERTGMKRKRLKRERFRKRFKEGFKRMVGIVLEMKKQGL